MYLRTSVGDIPFSTDMIFYRNGKEIHHLSQKAVDGEEPYQVLVEVTEDLDPEDGCTLFSDDEENLGVPCLLLCMVEEGEDAGRKAEAYANG